MLFAAAVAITTAAAEHFVIVFINTALSQPPPHICNALKLQHVYTFLEILKYMRWLLDWQTRRVGWGCDCFRAGARNQPLVQLQRKSLQLPSNSNYTALSAVLTTARTQDEIGGFPFLLGQETNSSGRRLRMWRHIRYYELVVFPKSRALIKCQY